jgi:hypothetical protein
MKEIDFFGLFISPFLLWGVAAFLLLLLLRVLLGRLGVYVHVWHRPLFDLSIYLILLFLLVSLARRLSL